MGLLFKTKIYFNSNQLSTIYKSHIRSQIEHCLSLWDGAERTASGRLDGLQNLTIILLNDKSVTDDTPPLQIQRNVASLKVMYRYL